MSLLQSPRRPSSDVLALGSTGPALDPDRAFAASGGLRDEDGLGVDLGRELDLSSERPSSAAPAGRGPVVLAASIVASSLALAGVIMLARGDAAPRPQAPAAAAPLAEVGAPAEEPAPALAEPAPSEVAPAEPPRRVAAQSVPTTKEPPKPVEITPAAIAPASGSRSTAPATGRAAADVEPTGGLAPGLSLPAPVFDEPAAPELPSTPEPSPTEPTDPDAKDDGAARDPLPDVEERAPAVPRDEPKPDATPDEAAEHSRAEPPAPALPVDPLDVLERLPARAERPAS